MKVKIKSWICEICHESVSEMGAYVKRTATQYAHAHCFAKKEYDLGWERGQRTLLAEQEQARREASIRSERERQEREAKERAEAERRLEIAERERTNRIIAAKNNPLPPKLEEAKKEAKDAKQEDRPDRFKLIDLE